MSAGTEEGEVMAAVTLAIASGDDLGLRELLKGLGRARLAQASSAEVEGADDGGVVGLWPLLVAVKCRNDSAVRLLVDDYGARSRLDAHGRTELHALAESQRGPFEPRPFAVASPPGRLGWLSDYVRSWMRLEPSPLSTGLRMWQLLISAGASPCAGDKYGATPFHIACSRGNWPAVEYLLVTQAQARRRSHRGMSDPAASRPLALLRDEQGETGLHWAARAGRCDVVALLLEQPDVDAKLEGYQGTAAEVARRNDHKHIAGMIDRATFEASPLMEMVVHILSFLEPFDLCTVAQVCTKLNELSSADTLWRHFCSSSESAAQSTKNEDEDEPPAARWKTAYMAWLRPRLKLQAQSQVLNRRAQATQPELVKVILLGDAGVGKTCLLQRYTTGQAVCGHVPTIGIDVATKMLQIHGNNVKLWLWEVGGRKCFWSLADSYYRTMQGVMLVYNAAKAETLKGVQDLYAWLLAKHACCCTPVLVAPILVGVRHHHGAGQPPASAVSEAQARVAAREIGALAWIEVDCSDDLQVDHAFTRLAEAAWAIKNQDFASCWLPAEYQAQWRIPSKALCDTLFARTALAQSPARSPTPPPPVA